jgi:hypothetical protein
MTMNGRCEIRGCGRTEVGTQNGIACCDRCMRDFQSIGFGAVFFTGTWHGVNGARYTAEQARLFPGLRCPDDDAACRGDQLHELAQERRDRGED